MRLTLPGGPGARAVLVTAPGPRVAETVHHFVEQGCPVTVRPGVDIPASVRAVLDDLATRSLVRVDAEADPAAFDIVVRDVMAGQSASDPTIEPSDGRGRVTLVGGGPGDPGLITVAGMAAISSADVIVCDRLAPLSVLEAARPDAEIVHVGKIPRGAFTPQEAINDLLVEHARRGRHVVRFKGGDGFVFGRGGEEWNACVAHGIPVSVIPGVSSAVAVPALAGIPVTHRRLSQGFVVVTGHIGPSDEASMLDWARLAQTGMTLVILMGVAALDAITSGLLSHGLAPDTPAACVANGSLPSQRQVLATVADIGERARDAGLTPPAITIIGQVVSALAQPE